MHYYIYHYASNGDLADISPYCSSSCQNSAFGEISLKDGRPDDEHPEGEFPPEQVILPTGHETDYDEYCDNCGVFLHHGLNCDHEDKSVPAPDADMNPAIVHVSQYPSTYVPIQ